MSEKTAIGWTDHTFNPWWGCERVSPACQHCYAETFAKRTGNLVWGKNSDRRFFGDKHWAEPMKWERAAAEDGLRHLVFCASMADVFEDRPDLMEHRERLWDLITATPHLTWQLLTKRPENVLSMVPVWWHGAGFADHAEKIWPRNAWIGTTVEDQKHAYERIGWLKSIPAPVRFLSCEPMLGPVDLNPDDGTLDWVHAIDWVICGGESGAGHRALNLDYARSLRDQCAENDIPFFFKQVGGQYPKSGGDELDDVSHKHFPLGVPRVSPNPTTPTSNEETQ